MYKKSYEFRYSDLDKNRNLKLSVPVDLLQDISIFHTHSVGLKLDELYSDSIAWLLEGWRIKFRNKIDPYKGVDVVTGIMKLGRCDAVRKYEIFQSGELKLSATAVWYTVNMDKRKIVHVPEGFADYYESVNEEDNNLPYMKLKPVSEAEFIAKTTVEFRDIDTNDHMNNVKSIETVTGFLPDDFEVEELQVKYLKELRKGEKISIFARETEEGFYFDLRNEREEICVIINVINAK